MSVSQSAYDQVVRLLSRREHSAKELNRKLKLRGWDESAIDSALSRLEKEGLLNHERFVEAYIRARRGVGYGPRRIALELEERGVEENLIQQALCQKITAEEWKKDLEQVWRKKFRARKPQDVREYAQQARFLSYRGFELESIAHFLKKKE